MLREAWTWISKPRIQRTLGFLGGGIAVLAGAIWQVYVAREPRQIDLGAVPTVIRRDQISLDCSYFDPGPAGGVIEEEVKGTDIGGGEVYIKKKTQSLLAKYPDKEKAVIDLYLIYLLCRILESDTASTPQQKLSLFQSFQRDILHQELKSTN